MYLVFSSLIIPALAIGKHAGKQGLAMGYALGALGYASGLALSALFDLPSGAVIVWALAACALLVGFNRSGASIERKAHET